MEHLALEKFMKLLNLKLTLSTTKVKSSKGEPIACVHAYVIKNDDTREIVLNMTDCYAISDGKFIYWTGTVEKGVEDGILKYIGDSEEIESYLSYLMKEEAKLRLLVKK